MKLLKQSTSVTIKLGPFLDSSDGVTAEGSLTISQSDILLSKNFGAFAQKNDATGATHDTAGWYGVPLNATDTGTLGPLQIHVNESGALPVFDHYTVVPANIYDSWVLGTDLQQVDTQEIDSSTGGAQQLALSASTIYSLIVDNTAFTATETILETSSITTAAANHWIGRLIIFNSGTLAGQATRITNYALSSGRGRFTYDSLTSAPANATSAIIV